MCSSIVFVPNKICRAAALLVFGSKHISAVLLFPSSILLCAITTGDIITQKHAVKTIHATKIVTSPSNEIVIVRNDWSFSVKVLVWACFSRRAPKKTEHPEWSWIQHLLILFCVFFCGQTTQFKGANYTLSRGLALNKHRSVNDINSQL